MWQNIHYHPRHNARRALFPRKVPHVYDLAQIFNFVKISACMRLHLHHNPGHNARPTVSMHVFHTDMMDGMLSFVELQGTVKGTLSPCTTLHGCFSDEDLPSEIQRGSRRQGSGAMLLNRKLQETDLICRRSQITHPVSIQIMTSRQEWSSILQFELVPNRRNMCELLLVLLGHIIASCIPAHMFMSLKRSCSEACMHALHCRCRGLTLWLGSHEKLFTRVSRIPIPSPW